MLYHGLYTSDVHRPCADNVELGTACGKLHRVSVLAITDAGECYMSNGMLAHVVMPHR
jgi:ribosomal protein L30E